jgi:hypothetical protein
MKSVVLLTFTLAFGGCRKQLPVPNGNDRPPDLRFALLDKHGNSLLTSTSTPLNVYWLNRQGQRENLGLECAGGGCTMVREGHSPSASGSPKYPFYYSSGGASEVSASTTKTFYLELNGKTDTLTYDVQLIRPNDLLDKYEIKSVIFNGKVASVDLDQYSIYVFQRRH